MDSPCLNVLCFECHILIVLVVVVAVVVFSNREMARNMVANRIPVDPKIVAAKATRCGFAIVAPVGLALMCCKNLALDIYSGWMIPICASNARTSGSWSNSAIWVIRINCGYPGMTLAGFNCDPWNKKIGANEMLIASVNCIIQKVKNWWACTIVDCVASTKRNIGKNISKTCQFVGTGMLLLSILYYYLNASIAQAPAHPKGRTRF
jgi:hypothetical protein